MQAEVFSVFAPFIYHYPLGNHWFQNEDIYETYLIIDPKPKADLPQMTHKPKSKTHKWLGFLFLFLFLRFYLFIFREGGREGERGKHQCVVASCAPPTGDLAHNPGLDPDWELNCQRFGS